MTEVRPRLSDLGVRIGILTPGPHNAITDVADVRVGHVTLMEGDAVRTGATAVMPHPGNVFEEKVVAAVHVINAFGKSIGLPQIAELGEIETPILLTGTLNVWRVADGLLDHMIERNPTVHSFNLVVTECNDSFLNDAHARPVGREHVFRALESASDGPVGEGCVGAGMGMSGFGFKAGIGTASRMLPESDGGYTVGVLVLTNTGGAGDFRINGIPVGRELQAEADVSGKTDGSIILLVATDAPVSSRQLARIARRATFGLARAGGIAGHGSGDFVLAFSTAHRIVPATGATRTREMIVEHRITPLFRATIEATEEAIVNSVLKAHTVVGREGHVRHAIPIDRVAEIIGRYRDREG